MADVRIAEQRVLEEALARGYCTPDQLAAARVAASRGGGLLPTLRQRFLSAEQARELGRVYAQALQEPSEDSTIYASPTPSSGLEAETQDPPEIAGYQLMGELGRGGMGAVFRARDAEGELVALKIMHGQDPRKQARFEREAAVMRFVGRHPGVVALRDFGQSPKGLYLVMDLVDGTTLEHRLHQNPDDLTGLVRLVAQVADALHFAHEAGVVHRDVKPANILVQPDGTAMLTDFGVAKDLQEIQRLTRTQQLVGTVAYMAPEQAMPSPETPVDRRTDVYALGVVLYRILARVPPFTGQPVAILGLIGATEPKAPRQVRRDVPAALEGICLRAMQKVPAERYQTAAAVAVDLRRWLGEEASSSELLPAARRRRRTGPLVVIGTLLAIAAGTLGYNLERGPAVDADANQALVAFETASADERDDALAALRRAAEAQDEEGPAWLALALAAEEAGDLEAAADCLARAPELARVSADPRIHHLRGKLAERAGQDVEAAAAYQQAVEAGLAEVRVDFHRAGLGSTAGETAEDHAWRLLALGGGDLRPLLDAGLKRQDAPALVTLWEEAHRRLDPQARPLQQLIEGDRRVLLARLLDPDAPAPHRVAAALGLAQFDGTDVDDALAAAEAPASPHLLREAARVSRLVRAQDLAGFRRRGFAAGPETVSFTRWAAALPSESPDEGAAAAVTLLQLSHRLHPDDLPSLRKLADGSPGYLRRCLPMAIAISASRRAGVSQKGAFELLAQMQSDPDPRVVHQARVAEQALQVLGGKEVETLSHDALRLAFWLIDLPWREKTTREGSRWKESLQAAFAEVSDAGLLALRARLELADGDLAAAESTLAKALAGDAAPLVAHELDRQRRRLAGDAEPPPLPEFLREQDPVGFGRAGRRVEFCKRYQALALAGAHGALRAHVRFDLGPEPVERAVHLVAREDPGWMNLGLLVGERTAVQTRFAFSSLRRMELSGRQDGKTCTVSLGPFAGPDGWSGARLKVALRTDGPSYLERLPRRFDFIPHAEYVRRQAVLCFTHGWSELRIDGFGQLASRTSVRPERGLLHPRLSFGAAMNTQRLQRVVYEGRWTEAPVLAPAKEPKTWQPVAGQAAVKVTGNASKPKTVGDARVQGWRAQCAGAWAGPHETATRLTLGPALSEAVEVRARLEFSPLQRLQGFGLSFRGWDARGRISHINAIVAGPGSFIRDRCVLVTAQRSSSWAGPWSGTRKLTGTTICLSLKRVGAWVTARAGPSWGALKPLTPEPIYFPFEGAVEVNLLASSYSNTPGQVRFSDVELLVGR